MSHWHLILRSLIYHWRINFAVALGVAAATAVLTGALLVGDSVRGSLRQLTLDRLGKIDEVLVSDRFFDAGLAQQLADNKAFQSDFRQASPAILFPSITLELQRTETAARSSNVLLVGCDATFWDLSQDVRPQQIPGPNEIVLNQTLADNLRADIGSLVVARLPKGNQVPADSPLANKSDRIRSLPEIRVVDVIPARGLGRFSLSPSQSLPLVAFVAIETLQEILEQPGKVNAILVSLQPHLSPNSDAAVQASETLAAAFQPAFSDYGLSVKRVTRTFADGTNPSEMIYDYFSVTSDRMILSPAAEAHAGAAFKPFGGQGVVTYLANTMEKVREAGSDATDEPSGAIAYSMISGIDVTSNFPLLDVHGQPIGPLADDEIVLNSWAAADQNAEPGDSIRVRYFEPETTHGNAVETVAELKLKAITPLTEPTRPYRRQIPAEYDQRPTLANDPDLTPEVAGVTDQDTINDWDAPFPFDYKLVRSQDDNYWENHRTTPKAFVSLATGERLWSSRFGRITSFRIPARDGLTPADIEQAFLKELASLKDPLGLSFIPIKRQQLAASAGTTPFDFLFLGLSFFIIAAALLLVALLFRLGVEQRAHQIGLLLAVGLRRRQASRLYVAEGAIVAAIGSLCGVAVGIAYAWLMLAGLRTWWVGAITTPFLEFYWTGQTLVVGYVLGVVVSLLTIAWTVRQTRQLAIRSLLAGQTSTVQTATRSGQRRLTWVALVILVSAIGLAGVAVGIGGMAQAGAFLGAGFLMLTGLMMVLWMQLQRGGREDSQPFSGSWALSRFAWRNAGRNPGRSAATMGLMATACFLIVGLSSFRLAPSNEGAGGFDLIAQSSEPIFEDLNSAAGREKILGAQQEVLAGGLVFGLRYQPGDDASCNNLYRSTQPRVLGITDHFVTHFDAPDVARFRWMASEAQSEEERRNPWRLLNRPETGDMPAIPVAIDMNTAMYSLKPAVSVGSEFELTDENRRLRFHVVGLLENSVLQGSLLIGEANFQRHFPDVSGYRYFLIQSPLGRSQQVTELLEHQLGDQGFDVVRSSQVLEQLFAVQNTYLSTFQSLGALGLLLGTLGLAAVQMRNVIERRGELALLRAAGFRQRRVGQLVLLENVCLLVGGLMTGIIAALLAVLPHKLTGNASIPADLLRDLGVMLVTVFVVGVIASLVSVRASLRVPVLRALRGD